MPSLAALSVLALSACGNEPNSAPSPSNPDLGTNPNPNAQMVTWAQIKSCRQINASDNPAEGNCLKGKFVGRTTQNEACILFIGQNGDYYYQSPQLTYGYQNSTTALNYFTFDGVLINWGISTDSTKMNTTVSLENTNYQARIEVSHSDKSSVCEAKDVVTKNGET